MFQQSEFQPVRSVPRSRFEWKWRHRGRGQHPTPLRRERPSLRPAPAALPRFVPSDPMLPTASKGTRTAHFQPTQQGLTGDSVGYW